MSRASVAAAAVVAITGASAGGAGSAGAGGATVCPQIMLVEYRRLQKKYRGSRWCRCCCWVNSAKLVHLDSIFGPVFNIYIPEINLNIYIHMYLIDLGLNIF